MADCGFVCLICALDRCEDVESDERRREKKEEKCPLLENSGSEEDVLQILQYMGTILGKHNLNILVLWLCKHTLIRWLVHFLSLSVCSYHTAYVVNTDQNYT